MGLSLTVLFGGRNPPPLQGGLFGWPVPRALPWASQLRAVGAAERNDLAALADGLMTERLFQTPLKRRSDLSLTFKKPML
jgi:hypothetical protein